MSVLSNRDQGGEKKGVFDESLKDGLVVAVDPSKREEQDGKLVKKGFI